MSMNYDPKVRNAEVEKLLNDIGRIVKRQVKLAIAPQQHAAGDQSMGRTESFGGARIRSGIEGLYNAVQAQFIWKAGE